MIAGGLILSGLAAAFAFAAGETPIRAAQWIAAGRAPVRALTVEPPECLATKPGADYSVELGRAAFRHPLLLGNQGARAGLSCESCHRNGHDNPDFAFPGLSDAPGTADVTSSVTSEHRGDGVFNPKQIPSLTDRPDARKVSRDPGRPDLKNFIHGLVTEEFDGPEPPPAVMEGLAAYVRALSPAACPMRSLEPTTVAARMGDVRRALATGREALVRGDPSSARVMIAAARSGLGLIAERFDGPLLRQEHDTLAKAAAGLGRLQNNLGASDIDAGLADWDGKLDALEKQLQSREAQSLFNPRQLAAHLKER